MGTTYTYSHATATPAATSGTTESTVATSVIAVGAATVPSMTAGRCDGNGGSQLGFGGMDKNKCFQRVQESMQVSNCARVPWHPNINNQPQCMCFSSCSTVSQPQGESGWETYTYDGTTEMSGSHGAAAISAGAIFGLAAFATVF